MGSRCFLSQTDRSAVILTSDRHSPASPCCLQFTQSLAENWWVFSLAGADNQLSSNVYLSGCVWYITFTKLVTLKVEPYYKYFHSQIVRTGMAEGYCIQHFCASASVLNVSGSSFRIPLPNFFLRSSLASSRTCETFLSISWGNISDLSIWCWKEEVRLWFNQ